MSTGEQGCLLSNQKWTVLFVIVVEPTLNRVFHSFLTRALTASIIAYNVNSAGYISRVVFEFHLLFCFGMTAASVVMYSIYSYFFFFTPQSVLHRVSILFCLVAWLFLRIALI